MLRIIDVAASKPKASDLKVPTYRDVAFVGRGL
jgi:hypothetical protein